MNIFNIKQEYIDILNKVEEAEGEITDSLYDILIANEADRDEALTELFKLIRQNELYASNVKDEMQRLSKLKASMESRVDTLKKTMVDLMEFYKMHGKSGNLTYSNDYFKAYTRNSSSVVIDEYLLHDYDPIDGFKESPFISFTTGEVFTKDEIVALKSNDNHSLLQYSFRFDKRAIAAKLKEETSNSNAPIDVFNPDLQDENTVDFAKIEVNTSLILK